MRNHIISFLIISSCDSRISVSLLTIIQHHFTYQKLIAFPSAVSPEAFLLHWKKFYIFKYSYTLLAIIPVISFNMTERHEIGEIIIHCIFFARIFLAKYCLPCCHPLQNVHHVLNQVIHLCCHAFMQCCKNFSSINNKYFC